MLLGWGGKLIKREHLEGVIQLQQVLELRGDDYVGIYFELSSLQMLFKEPVQTVATVNHPYGYLYLHYKLVTHPICSPPAPSYISLSLVDHHLLSSISSPSHHFSQSYPPAPYFTLSPYLSVHVWEITNVYQLQGDLSNNVKVYFKIAAACTIQSLKLLNGKIHICGKYYGDLCLFSYVFI